MICHLKDKMKIRHKKRWSQVMYMYYLLGHRLMDLPISVDRKEVIAENTYLLALDGDIDFKPSAVTLLIDLMKKDKNLGAACGRIHPVGSGFMAWYQVFEYAIGHWLQKATEHMIGCVLCSPGCFSLFRGKGLMDDNVMRKYTLTSSEARHYVQYDQGYRVEYSAASDAYTHCPERFDEFFNQRRRWVPSTMANILDLLGDSKHTVKVNDNISMLHYIPDDDWSHQRDNWPEQLTRAPVERLEDGWLAPTSIFFVATFGMFFATGILHPQEIKCLLYIAIYYITIPSMYMLLIIYSLCNLNNVSWGTREVAQKKTLKEMELEKKAMEEAKNKMSNQSLMSWFGKSEETSGSLEFSISGLFRCMCCTNPKDHKDDLHLLQISNSLDKIEKRLEALGAPPDIENSRPRRRSSIGMRADTLSLLPEDDLINPYWIEDPNLQKGEVDFLTTAETETVLQQI
ncbi:unnamed protein product [Leptidea sinapis]|uniref:chitin synthase n=1 Tax=Leptidea sinapis TaxID=189913 RepID=A0A5E4QVP3_9NEOP|nr:unnamed protein product [Leptidea sinapis]